MLDAVVVGGGPAGNQMALKLAQSGHRVAVVDYRTRLGDKLCTGIVGRECHDRYSISPELVLHEAREARFVAGDGDDIVVSRRAPQAYAVDRVGFVSGIAERAQSAGATYHTGAVVCGVDVRADGVSVEVRSGHSRFKLKARSIVVASGVGSKVAEMAGLSPARKLAYASQAVVESGDDEGLTVMLPGVLPAGHFGWSVPTGDGRAMVGVLGRPRDRTAGHRVLAAAQTAGRVGAQLGEWKHWPVPVGPAPVTVNHRALLVGDAAGQVKPTTGGGIYYSLLSADLAAATLDRSLAADDLSAQSLSAYDTAWKAALGRELRVGRIARAIFERLDGATVKTLLRASEASGLFDEDGSFDWHSKLIIRGLGYRMFDAALAPFKSVGNALSTIV